MTTTTTTDLPLPAGAEPDIWQEVATTTAYRILYGASRGVEDHDEINVSTTVVQFKDGSLDNGSIHEEPLVYVQTNCDTGLRSAEARELAAVLIECADEIDGWARVGNG